MVGTPTNDLRVRTKKVYSERTWCALCRQEIRPHSLTPSGWATVKGWIYCFHIPFEPLAVDA